MMKLFVHIHCWEVVGPGFEPRESGFTVSFQTTTPVLVLAPYLGICVFPVQTVKH